MLLQFTRNWWQLCICFMYQTLQYINIYGICCLCISQTARDIFYTNLKTVTNCLWNYSYCLHKSFQWRTELSNLLYMYVKLIFIWNTQGSRCTPCSTWDSLKAITITRTEWTRHHHFTKCHFLSTWFLLLRTKCWKVLYPKANH